MKNDELAQPHIGDAQDANVHVFNPVFRFARLVAGNRQDQFLRRPVAQIGRGPAANVSASALDPLAERRLSAFEPELLMLVEASHSHRRTARSTAASLPNNFKLIAPFWILRDIWNVPRKVKSGVANLRERMR